ncbi:MAG TPA: hypothetical protein VFI73_12415 [Candidatus Nitrosopolaris sp.]|nr:hypothetical protein [Candidatus Nitrosopolaris sp.]
MWKGFLTLNIVQPFNLTVPLAPTTLNSVTTTPGGSANASRQINDTARFIGVAIHVESNSSNATQTQGLSNVTLKESVRNPNGIIMSTTILLNSLLLRLNPILQENIHLVSTI